MHTGYHPKESKLRALFFLIVALPMYLVPANIVGCSAVIKSVSRSGWIVITVGQSTSSSTTLPCIALLSSSTRKSFQSPWACYVYHRSPCLRDESLTLHGVAFAIKTYNSYNMWKCHDIWRVACPEQHLVQEPKIKRNDVCSLSSW